MSVISLWKISLYRNGTFFFNVGEILIGHPGPLRGRLLLPRWPSGTISAPPPSFVSTPMSGPPPMPISVSPPESTMGPPTHADYSSPPESTTGPPPEPTTGSPPVPTTVPRLIRSAAGVGTAIGPERCVSLTCVFGDLAICKIHTASHYGL